jgi:hypothetical protein
MLREQIRLGWIFGIEIGLQLQLVHHRGATDNVAGWTLAITREDVNQLVVLEEGGLRGIVSRDQILRLLSTRAELTM